MADRIEENVVTMTFDNDSFERKLSETIKSLDKLKDSLDFASSSDIFEGISTSANSVNFNGMSSAIDDINSKFSVMGAIAFSAIQHITQGILGFVSSIVNKIKGDVFEPIITGGKARAQNIDQAKFMFRGLGIDVEKGMESAKAAVLGTSFGLDEAAKVASQFGASGIKVGTDMTGALRGVAGAAAMTGSSFTEIGAIFADVAGKGKLSNQDLLQFATRGLNAAAAIGKVMNKTEAQIHDMAREGQIDFKTFAVAMDKAFGEHATKANETYSGSLANMHAAMSRLGEAFIGPRLTQMRDVFNTLTPVIDKFAKALKPVIAITTEITRIGSVRLIKFLNSINFEPIERAFKTMAIVLTNFFHLFFKITGAISAAFKIMFPSVGISMLVKVANLFLKLSQRLQPSLDVIHTITAVFAALFGILKVGWLVIKETVALFKELLAPLKGTGVHLAELIHKVAETIVKFERFLIEGGAIHRFFIRIREVIHDFGIEIDKAKVKISDFFDKSLKPILEKFGLIGSSADTTKEKVKSFYEGFTRDQGESADDSLGRIQQRLDQLKNAFDKIKPDLDKAFDSIKQWFSDFGKKISETFGAGDFDNAVDAVNVGLIGGILYYLKKFVDGGFKLDIGGLRDKIEALLDTFTEKTKAMTANIKADTLLKIAAAMAVLTASLVVLSLIDSAALTKALTAVAAGFAMMVVVMQQLDKMGGDTGGGKKGLVGSFIGDQVGGAVDAVGKGGKLGLISAALIAMSTAMLIMAGAIKVLSSLNPKELATGLAGIAYAMSVLIAATLVMSTNTDGLIIGAGAIASLAASLLVLSGVAKIFASMSLEELAKGLGGIAATLAILVGATLLLSTEPAGLIAGSIAIGIMAASLFVLSGVVKLFSMMSLEEMAKGLGGIAATLLVLIGATYLISTNAAGLIAGGIAMGIMAVALNILAGAIKIMASISLGDLIKSIAAFAYMLTILAIGVTVLAGALPGAIALVIIAGAMLILANVLEKFAALKITDLLKGLYGMAAVFALLAGAAVAMQPVIPLLLALGIALAVVGTAFLLFGAGVALLAKGLETLARSGAKGLEVLVTALPKIAHALTTEVIKSLEDLLNAVPMLVKILTVILDQLLDTIIKLAPKLGKALIVLFTEGLKALTTIYPKIIQAGIDLLLALLNGIANNIDKVITAALNIIINFAQSIVDNIPRVVSAIAQVIIAILAIFPQYVTEFVTAGTNMLINFLFGITSNVIKIIEAVALIIQILIFEIGKKAIDIANAGTAMLVAFLTAMADNAVEIVNAVGRLITTFITAISDKATDIANAGTKALVNFLNGLSKDIPEIAQAAVKMVGNFLTALGNAIGPLAQAGFDLLITFIDAISEAIDKNAERLGKSLGGLASALVAGFRKALFAAFRQMANDMPAGIGKVVNGIFDALGVDSPSTVFHYLGKMLMLGLSNGINQNIKGPAKAIDDGGDTILNSMNNTMSKLSNALGDTAEFNPVITPVLDLTKVQSASRSLSSLISSAQISPEVSLARARTIATTADLTGKEFSTTPEVVKEITFEQTINSPTALSTNDIYRNTKSQIALAKEKLGIAS